MQVNSMGLDNLNS